MQSLAQYKPLFDAVAETLGSLVLLMLVRVAHAATAHFAAQANQTQQFNYEQAIRKSVEQVISTSANKVEALLASSPTLINYAAAYMLQRFPETTKAVGVTTADQASVAIRRLLPSIANQHQATEAYVAAQTAQVQAAQQAAQQAANPLVEAPAAAEEKPATTMKFANALAANEKGPTTDRLAALSDVRNMGTRLATTIQAHSDITQARLSSIGASIDTAHARIQHLENLAVTAIVAKQTPDAIPQPAT